jgi:2-keto-4-pentenoate hydratase
VTGPTGAAGSFGESQTLNAQATGYTLVLSDAGKLVTFNTTGAVNVVIPAASSVAFATGTHVDVARLNSGAVTVTGATGVTVNGTPGKKLRAQYSAGSLILYAGDTWLVVGDLST